MALCQGVLPRLQCPPEIALSLQFLSQLAGDDTIRQAKTLLAHDLGPEYAHSAASSHVWRANSLLLFSIRVAPYQEQVRGITYVLGSAVGQSICRSATYSPLACCYSTSLHSSIPSFSTMPTYSIWRQYTSWLTGGERNTIVRLSDYSGVVCTLTPMSDQHSSKLNKNGSNIWILLTQFVSILLKMIVPRYQRMEGGKKCHWRSCQSDILGRCNFQMAGSGLL